MPTVEGLSPEILWYTLIGIVGLGALIVLADKILSILHRHQATSASAIAADVAVQNKRITAIEEGNKVLCQGIVALLSHEINGNSIDKLRQAQTDLTNYLINK